MQQQQTAAEQVNALNQNLVKAYTEREEAQATVDRTNASIVAIRNVLAGIQIGAKLQTEVLAEEAAKTAAVADASRPKTPLDSDQYR